MTVTGLDAETKTVAPSARSRPGRDARSPGSTWPATCVDRETIQTRLTGAPFTTLRGGRPRGEHQFGVRLLLDWLEQLPGDSWQDRWLASGVEAAGRAWRDVPKNWLSKRGMATDFQRDAFFRALLLAVAADVIRPSVSLLVVANWRRGALPNALAQCRDTAAFTRLRELCSGDPAISRAAATRISYRTAIIVAAK
ncbi:site-specific integrase, partial [Actinoplanes sp. TBRC 11911]|uniref:hypothetical protein n=1 Tax=Actinoplanes sp. TBRC 11911 TaxID=2729386 RepID=UPI0017C842B0